MNTRAPENNGEIKHASHDYLKSRKNIFKVFAIVTSTAAALSLAACGGASPTTSQAGATQSASTSASATPTPTPTPTPTAPKSASCVTENTTESYPPKVYICTKSDAGTLVWMERSESKKVTDARAAAAAAKAAADKAAADKAAADKAAADKAAADQAAADAAAAQAAAAQAAQAAAAQAAAKQAAPAAPSGCDPNYAWACVPIASDVDCAGGKGNGPAYVRGPVKVIGTDIYGLDNDGDGIGCEK